MNEITQKLQAALALLDDATRVSTNAYRAIQTMKARRLIAEVILLFEKQQNKPLKDESTH
jgi:hypothetical protein